MDTLKQTIAEAAKALGFDAIRFASADAVAGAGDDLDQFLAEGRQGDMAWLAGTAERRKAPRALWPEARSVILLGLNYGRPGDPLAILQQPSRGAISIYAQGADYHDVLKAKLKPLAARVQALTQSEVKLFADTAPVMEKPLAARAGLGWQGKHTNLVSREFGSWLFIGSIFTTAEIAPDAPEDDHCGACRRCLDICPTQAFTAPYRIDARACISYLTIEHKGHIAPRFRAAMGNRIFGCDDCLAVCPWNKFAQSARETKLSMRAESDNPPLAELLLLDDAAFRARFRGTPIKRTGRDRFLRNVLIAAGNSGRRDARAIGGSAARGRFAAGARHGGMGNVAFGAAALPGLARRARRRSRSRRAKRVDGSGGVNRLFCFGLGFSAQTLAERLAAKGWQIAGTARDVGKIGHLAERGYEIAQYSGEAGNSALPKVLHGTTHLLHSIPPGPAGDPVLEHYREELAKLPSLEWVGYLSTVGVYGHQEGRWVDETTVPRPNSARTEARVQAEQAWLEFGRETGVPVQIFRLAGIYGPGRSVFDKLKAGTARRIKKDGQVFSRIHVEDIASVLEASIARPHAGAIYNVADDEPAAPDEVVAYAAKLIGVEPPPEIDFVEADLTPMARSFYEGSRRIGNKRIKSELGVKLRYPTYREGLASLLA